MRHLEMIKNKKAVIINEQDGIVWANLYVNVKTEKDTYRIIESDITLEGWKGKTVAGAKKWATKKLI